MVELKRIVVAVVFGVLLLVPGDASATRSGGAYASEPATITAVSCVADCASIDAARPGSLLRVRGGAMSDVATIVFLGGRGHDDNATARVRNVRRDSLDVVVPEKAISGRLRAVNGDGARSAASRPVVSVLRGATGNALELRVVGKRVFYDATRPARIDLMAREAMNVTVTLVRVADGAAVMGWPLALAPGVVSSVLWDGRAAGVPQPAGRYEFRVTGGAPSAGAVAAAAAPDTLAAAVFDLVDHKFPVRGNHNYGEGQAAFGAGRNGHTHEGQDVFASCGTPLVAARGGVVKLNRTHSAGGNYIVIDGEGTDVDYAYMHMREPSPLAKGARVRTGQLIGHVGDTGDSNGCHLHFEMWSGPGWYTGGAPVDPLPFLKAWDAYS